MSTRDISCNLGENVTGIGFQLLTDPGVAVGTRVTADIFNPRPGVYIARGVDTTGATNVHWDNATGDVFADDVFEPVATPAPTAAENAAALLKLDFSGITGEASFSALNALRFVRGNWSITGSTLTVFKEDGTTPAYTHILSTDAGAVPIVGVS